MKKRDFIVGAVMAGTIAGAVWVILRKVKLNCKDCDCNCDGKGSVWSGLRKAVLGSKGCDCKCSHEDDSMGVFPNCCGFSGFDGSGFVDDSDSEYWTDGVDLGEFNCDVSEGNEDYVYDEMYTE